MDTSLRRKTPAPILDLNLRPDDLGGIAPGLVTERATRRLSGHFRLKAERSREPSGRVPIPSVSPRLS